jgi:hypothetical protein
MFAQTAMRGLSRSLGRLPKRRLSAARVAQPLGGTKRFGQDPLAANPAWPDGRGLERIRRSVA